MNNVGEFKTFILNGNVPTQAMAYVWKWWDNSVDVTSNGTISKQLNVGGDPSDSYNLRFACEAVNEVGQSSEFLSTISVNNPPSIVLGSTTLSKNGDDFVFRTTASVIAYDLENEAVAFAWFAGGQSIGGGSPTYTGSVSGTYAGTYCGDYSGTQSYVTHDVVTNGSLTCLIYDTSGGTTAIQFDLFGQSPAQSYSAPQVVPYLATIDSASEPVVRIGVGEYAEFSVYTQANSNPTSFQWAFYGSNGWAATTFDNGTTTALEDGAFQNSVLKTTVGETVGHKTAECLIVDTVTGQSATVDIPVQFIANTGPVIGTVTILPASPVSGDVMSLEVNATDADADLLIYQWYFPDFGRTLYGRKVFISNTGILSGNPLFATVTVTDRLGNSASENVESGVIS